MVFYYFNNKKKYFVTLFFFNMYLSLYQQRKRSPLIYCAVLYEIYPYVGSALYIHLNVLDADQNSFKLGL